MKTKFEPIRKEHILSEIKRTAETNGGVALGRQRFFAETGIKQSDWMGIHWIRWSDAIREAGFVANELSRAFDKHYLLDQLARLAIELGRLPLSADLRMKARNDSAFPSHTVFGRLGTKPDIIRQLSVHCKDRNEYISVSLLCEQHETSQAKQASEVEGSDEVAEIEFGFVYLGKSGRYYKIGKSNSTGRREYELSIQLPEKVKILHEIRTDDPSGIEAYWHNRFKEKRKNGEWFDLTAQDVAAFKRRKFM